MRQAIVLVWRDGDGRVQVHTDYVDTVGEVAAWIETFPNLVSITLVKED